MREDIYNEIKSRIINLHYKPNECLTENQISKEFNVSRTPIREVMILLSAENLVTITPKNSIRVSDINLRGLQELISYRIILEKGAARLMTASFTESDLNALTSLKEEVKQARTRGNPEDLISCDTRFHEIIRKATHNNLLAKSLSAVHSQFTRIQKLIRHTPDKMSFHLDAIIESLKQKDGERIENCLVEHVYNFVTIINNSFKAL